MLGLSLLFSRACIGMEGEASAQSLPAPQPSSPAPIIESTPPQLSCTAVPWRPTTHLPGTLLRDHEGRFWVADRWPDRRELVASMMPQSHYQPDEAILLSAEEERCLRPSTAIWYPRMLWRLKRLTNGTYWYVDEAHHYRRSARPVVMAAWRDALEGADAFDLNHETFEQNYRDLGPMPPPDGALFLSDASSYLFTEGVLHRFESRDLFHLVGYDDVPSVIVSASALHELGPIGAELTRSTFSVCPLAAAQLRRTEDHDEDGTPFFEDCDDDNARRAPGQREICDGIDNDCDLVIDNGFHVGYRCTMDDACHTQTYTRCTDDHTRTVCLDDEARCDR